jgi:hypothetical protein
VRWSIARESIRSHKNIDKSNDVSGKIQKIEFGCVIVESIKASISSDGISTAPRRYGDTTAELTHQVSGVELLRS